jgi:hypothetical protein
VRFKKTRKGVEVRVEQVEAEVLVQCASELLELLGPGPEADEDPLAAMVGLSDASRPDDPAVLRLFPDAYAPDHPDSAAAADFRRYTDADLRSGKRAAAAAVLATVPARGGSVLLDRDDCDRWLGCLNDLRLVLGTRLAVTEETEMDDVAEDDRQLYAIYGWLGWAQESLLSCLTPRSPGGTR